MGDAVCAMPRPDMRRKDWVAIAACLAWIAVAPIARAAPPETTSQQEAREAFAAGERAFARADHAQALVEFERTFRLQPHDAVRFNIGVCLERLRRFKEALAQYERASESPTLSPVERARAKDFAERTRKELGTLVVSAPTPGAPVTIEGEVRCSVPCRIELDPKAYAITVNGRERQVRIERGAALTIDLALDPPRAAPVTPPSQPVDASPAPVPPVTPKRRGPTFLTWTGASLAVVGVAGVAGFGLRTEALRDDYVAQPSQDTRDAGIMSRTLTNASLGVACVGGALIALDWLFFATKEAR